MKKITLIIVLVFASSFCYSQSAKYPTAQPGHDGIFVLLSGGLSNSSFTIERSEPRKNNWVTVGTIKTVSSSAEFVSNFEHYSNLFADLLKPQNDQLENLWNTLQRTKNLDSIYYYGNSPVLRLALGITFFDSSAEKNKSYQYKISEYDSVRGSSSSLTTNEVKFPSKLNFGKAALSSVHTSSDNVFVQWRILPNERLSSFLVFRQTNSKDEFEKISISKGFNVRRDSILLTIKDLTVTQNNLYKYFIVPIDLFGNIGDESDIVTCGAYDFGSVVLPMNISVESIDTLSALKLKWEIPSEQPAVNLELFRSEYFDSAYTLLAALNLSDNEYLDQNIKPMQNYFYYFRLVGPMNEISPATARVFGFCRSSEVPIPPSNIHAETIKNGVKLSWQNTENFIEGFWIYRSDNSNDSLRLVSRLIKEQKPLNVFYDTLRLSGKLTYNYSIRSSSSSHILSDFSDTISIRPNIKTNSPQPTEFSVQLDDSAAVLTWNNMMEIDSTVWGYNVFRKTIDKNKKSDFKSITDSGLAYNQNSFVDRTIKPGSSYEYQVVAYDWFGNSSDPASVSLSYSYSKPAAPEGLTASSIKEGVELNWNESLQHNIKEYKVYKQTRESKPILLGTVKPNKEMKITDKSVKKGDLYFYFVTVITQNDLESDASRIISFRP